MAGQKKTKKCTKGKTKKGKKVANAKPQSMATTPVGISARASVDAELVSAELTSSQCTVWRQGEFRKRVREAVADWAQEPPSSVSPTNTLGELAKGTPWNTGQQVRLVQTVNAHNVFAPPFPGTSMMAPSQLLPASTTVAQWEGVVWRHQNPETPCFPFTN
jgi:hypothetical protein